MGGARFPPPPARRTWRPWLAIAALTIATAAAIWGVRTRAVTVSELRFEATSEGVTAFDRTTGRQRWRHAFPGREAVTLLDRDTPLRVAQSGDPGVFVASAMTSQRIEGVGKGGVFTWLDAVDGHVRRSFEFDDEMSIQGRKYGAPWVLTSFAIDETGGSRRIAVAGHHWTWDPGLVTVLDEQWRRRGTFVHAGWIEGVRWAHTGSSARRRLLESA